jgi:hypothetical protein
MIENIDYILVRGPYPQHGLRLYKNNKHIKLDEHFFVGIYPHKGPEIIAEWAHKELKNE